MSNVINKKTGQYLKSVHTPDYNNNSDWVINPSKTQITTYLKKRPVIDEATKLKEQKIMNETYRRNRETSITTLKASGEIE